jgi:adhesin transport system outer membrane protein
MAVADAGGADSPFYPRFDAELSGTTGEDIDGIEGVNNTASAEIVARWNLFRGGSDLARRDAAIARKMRAQDVIARTERNQSEQTRFAWNAMQSARERVVTLRQVVDSNERVRDSYRKQFELGQRSLLDLLDSENELFLSRSDLVTAEYTALFGAYRLMSAMGTLTQNLGVKINQVASANAAH